MQTTGNIQPVDPVQPDPGLIAKAVEVIRQGGIVLFPTTGLYGLGGNAFDDMVVGRIFQLKKRPPDNPILILVSDSKELSGIVRDVPGSAEAIIDALWPGNVTLVFRAADSLPDNLTAGTGKIGVRIPAHPVAFALVSELGTPLTGTSANLSGKLGGSLVSEIDSEIVNHVELVLDAGQLKGGSGSTVVDVTGPKPKILREGEIPIRDIISAVENAS